MIESKPWKIHKLGNTERWYDPHTRCWWIRVLDENGDQIGECDNCYLPTEAKRIQRLRAGQRECAKRVKDKLSKLDSIPPRRRHRNKTWPVAGEPVGSLRTDDWS